MPTIQQQASKMIREQFRVLMTTAQHVPADKRDWVPQGAARTVQAQVVECALTPYFFLGILSSLLT